MATKHLANFYSYKVSRTAVETLPDIVQPQFAGATPTLESQVRDHMARGNELFFQDRYQDALEEYTTAYSLIHRFLHPSVPVLPGAGIATRLRGIRAFDSLLVAAAEVAKYRHVAGPMPLISPDEPSPELMKVVVEFGVVGAGERPSLARGYYSQALVYLHMGAADAATGLLNRAQQANQGADAALQLHLTLAQAAAVLQGRDPDKAESLLNNVQKQFQGLKLDGDSAAASNNLGVLHTLNGNGAQAGAAFAAAGNHLPLDMARTLQQPLNPGTADTMVRPMGRGGLQLVLRDFDQSDHWVTVPAAAPLQTVAASRLGVLTGDGTVDIDLTAQPVDELIAKVYQPRITATTLAELNTGEFLPGNFVAYLSHSREFTLPLAIGDCYKEMGEFETALGWYEQARDYQFLNGPIEAPVVWLKMAKTILAWGNFLYQHQDKDGATSQYEQVVRLSAPNLDPASPLYLTPVFDGMTAAVTALLAAGEPLDADVHNPAVAEVVLLARLNLQNIAAGIDFPLLSLAREEVPVFTFEYLQNVARYFADHAIQAERTYITFKTNAEQEEFQRSTLQNAVDLEAANEQLENKKVDIANQQKAAVDANRAYADLQAANAKDLRDEYANISLQQNALDAEITYVGAPTTVYDFSGYGGYGVADGEHRADEVLRTLTQRRQELSRKLELKNMDGHIKELEAAVKVAQAQQAIAQSQVAAAIMQAQIATLRRQQAEQQLDLFDSREFTPDLWNRLANELKAISQSYLQQAIVIAGLMEQAYEFEIGEPVSVIKPSYTRNDLSGLLAGDFLLRDIDSFTFLRIIAGQKKQPMKMVLSLADRYPVQYLRSFQKTGRMEFRTDLSDFDLNYPGSYQQRIKRVEVVVEGLVGHGGIHGRLINTGLCLTRVRDGGIKTRMLKPETMLLSNYRIGADSLVFGADGQTTAIFENSPVATSWILELRPTVNDVIYDYITDIKLVMYYESFYDPDLASVVLEELAERQPLTGRRSVALRYELFDEFFAFQDSGEVRFTLRDTMIPFYQRDPQIDDLTILVQTDDGIAPAGLSVTVTTADTTTATQVADADGALSSGAAALDVFRGKALFQEWVISMPEAANQPRFDAGFKWSQVRNIVLVVEYGFQPLRIAGEPYVLMRDDFDRDTLAAFEVVDDAQADQKAPSNWIYNAADGRIEQHADIFGEVAGSAANGPIKPGSYLVRKSDATLPEVKDLLLIASLASAPLAAGIGLVFRWQDADNFYFFLMDGQRNYRRLGKKVGGVFQELATPAADLAHGYVAAQPITVRVRAKGDDLRVFFDGSLVLTGHDTDGGAAGRVGFFSWGNSGAQFDDLQVVEL